MPEAPEVKWVFMVVVIGALYMSKTKSMRHLGRYGPSRGPNKDNNKGVVVYRQPSTLVGSHKAYAPIEGLTVQQKADDFDRRSELPRIPRTEESKLMKSMEPEQRKAYLAKLGVKMGDKYLTSTRRKSLHRLRLLTLLYYTAALPLGAICDQA